MALGHILRVTERRPLVQVKLALDADGAVPRGDGGKPAWVTGAQARAHGHLLRAHADAILVGRQHGASTTIPLLTCRLPGLEDRSPVRVVLARELDGLAHSRLVRRPRASIRCGSFCGDATRTPRRSKPRARAIFRVPPVGGELWLPGVMEALVARGITRLLVEGGPATWRAFARRRPRRRGRAVPCARPTAARRSTGAGASRACTLRRDGRLRAFRSANDRQRRYDGVPPALAQRRPRAAQRRYVRQRGRQPCSPASSPTSARSSAREDGRFTIRTRYRAGIARGRRARSPATAAA